MTEDGGAPPDKGLSKRLVSFRYRIYVSAMMFMSAFFPLI
jgi:hypothetical protein